LTERTNWFDILQVLLLQSLELIYRPYLYLNPGLARLILAASVAGHKQSRFVACRMFFLSPNQQLLSAKELDASVITPHQLLSCILVFTR